MYFCGKFLVTDGLKTHVVPDPLKLFVKLGKERPTSDKILKENWRSFFDVTKAYSNNTVLENLVDQSLWNILDRTTHMLLFVQSIR
uniref:p10 n=1 Tax=Grapevine leafroll-associated virus 9 TaxID=184610 RepID=Q2A075_9CLOS|nr:P10 [Grapevine leafroll-associated virus 9]